MTAVQSKTCFNLYVIIDISSNFDKYWGEVKPIRSLRLILQRVGS
jgi:hypothetical protein